MTTKRLLMTLGLLTIGCGTEESNNPTQSCLSEGDYVATYTDIENACGPLESFTEHFMVRADGTPAGGSGTTPSGCTNSEFSSVECVADMTRHCKFPQTDGTVVDVTYDYSLDFVNGDGTVFVRAFVYQGNAVVSACTTNWDIAIRSE